MAEYDHLPVYKASYDLLQHVYRDRSLGSAPRDIKFTLIETLKKDILDILVSIYKAHYSVGDDDNKILHIRHCRELIPGIRARFRILYDLHIMNSHLFQNLSLEVESISKQLGAWHAKCLRRRESTAAARQTAEE